MQTHIVPVGFDYDRLIAPLIRDQFDVDRAILLEGAVGSDSPGQAVVAAELSYLLPCYPKTWIAGSSSKLRYRYTT